MRRLVCGKTFCRPLPHVRIHNFKYTCFMVSLVVLATGALALCVLIPSRATSFFVATSPMACDSRVTAARIQQSHFRSSSRGNSLLLSRTHRAAHQERALSRELSKAPRSKVSLQATAEDDQVISGSDEPPTLEQQRQAAAAAAARGKQLNVVCNDVVRTILDGNVTNEKERALALRLRLEEQRDALVSPDDAMSALFYDNLLLVCQHELHPDVDRLSGEYGKAWRTILHYVEDAGWQLTDPPFSISG